MRWPGILWRFAGWLLAPLVVWAVSLWGAWITFGVTASFATPRRAVLTGLIVAVALGTVTLLLWMRLLRKSPRLRKSLRVTREGLPVIEHDTAAPPPDQVHTTEESTR
jgi:hypothetical protein